MKKLTKSLLTLLLITTMLHTANAQERLGTLNGSYTSVLPAMFSADNSPHFLIKGGNACYVYDLDLNLQHSVTFPEIDTITTHYRYEYFDSETNEWVFATEGSSIQEVDRVSVWFFNIDETGHMLYNEYPMYVTQTLFNDDESYEYFTHYSPYIVWDTNLWEEDVRSIEEDVIFQGYQIVSENGNVVATFSTDEGYRTYGDDEVSIFRMNGNYYIIFLETPINHADEIIEYKQVVYRIESANSSSLPVISRVDSEFPIMVRPTLNDRSGEFVISLSESDNLKEIKVTDNQGRIVKVLPVRQGEKEIRIPANELSKGMNIINASSHKGKYQSKVIVK
ncbi:MAG: T9SS type A sorting domain-containing protein [Bacteroidales bacterium]|nr:T9SS type A sorting domain-containing protein [Bacteroidales bacterium]